MIEEEVIVQIINIKKTFLELEYKDIFDEFLQKNKIVINLNEDSSEVILKKIKQYSYFNKVTFICGDSKTVKLEVKHIFPININNTIVFIDKKNNTLYGALFLLGNKPHFSCKVNGKSIDTYKKNYSIILVLEN